MKIEIRRENDVCVLACSGTLVLGGGDGTLRSEFAARLEDGDRSFVFDLTRLDYMDSSGVGAMVACARRAEHSGGVIKIALPENSRVRRVFEVTHLDSAFEVFTTPAEAVASFDG